MYIFIGRHPKTKKIVICHHPRNRFHLPTLQAEIVLHVKDGDIVVVKNRYGENVSTLLRGITSGDLCNTDMNLFYRKDT